MKRYYNLTWIEGFPNCVTPCPVKQDGSCIGSLNCQSCGYFLLDSFDYDDYMNGNVDVFVECLYDD